MSDKKKIHIQDRGWNEMQAILDKELPVKKKRRFAIWFFYGGLAIVLVALLGWMNFSNFGSETIASNLKKTSSKIELEKIEISDAEQLSVNTKSAAAPESGEAKEISNIEIAPNNTNENSAEANDNSVATNVKNSASPRSFKTQNSTKQLQVSSSFSKNIIKTPATLLKNISENSMKMEGSGNEESGSDALIISDENLPKFPVQAQLSDIQNANEEELENGPLNKKTIERPIVFPFVQLPMIKQFDFKREPLDFALATPIIRVDIPHTFATYLLASSSYQPTNNGFGIGMGAGLSYGNIKQELYVEAGYVKSNYSSGSLSNDFSPVGDVKVLDGNFEGGSIFPGNTNEFDLSVSNFEELVTSTNELKFSAGLRRKVFTNFNLDLGISYTRLLQAKNKSLEVDFENGVIADGSIVNIESTQLYNSGAFSDFDIVPHLGLEYDLNSKFNFGLFYNFGLKNLIVSGQLDRLNSLSDNDAIYRRNISAKIRYQF